MFRLHYTNFSEKDVLFDILIPPKTRKLHSLLKKVDILLKDETFEEPFQKF